MEEESAETWINSDNDTYLTHAIDHNSLRIQTWFLKVNRKVSDIIQERKMLIDYLIVTIG